MTRKQQRRANRLRRRQERLEAKAQAARGKADAFESGSKGRGTLTVGGQRTEVELDMEQIQALTRRIAAAELALAKQEARIESAEEAIEEQQEDDDARTSGNMLLSNAAIGALRALVAVLNVGDKIQNTAMYVAATALDALADSDQLEPDQEQWARVGSLIAQIGAYYDPEEGFASITGKDKPVEIEGAGPLPGGSYAELSARLDALVDTLDIEIPNARA